MVALRAERARLLGYENFADFRLDDTMAKTPEAALDLLALGVGAGARAGAARAATRCRRMVQAEGGNFELAPWDWRYYAEQRRKAEFDFDEGEIKPYLQLDRMIEAAFDTARRLFGLSFTERRDVPVYHPDVRAWEVTGADGRHVGLFLGDYFARPSKRSGAWMSGFRGQEKLAGDIRPIVVNVMNFDKPPDGEPALLELRRRAHALPRIRPRAARAPVRRDLSDDRRHERVDATSSSSPRSSSSTGWSSRKSCSASPLHYRDRRADAGGAAEAACSRRATSTRALRRSSTSPRRWSISISTCSPSATTSTPTAFESDALERIGMPEAIVMRHRPPHFGHIFSGAAIRPPTTAISGRRCSTPTASAPSRKPATSSIPRPPKRLHDYVYSAGNLRDPAEAYRAFRGRTPDPQALLKKRGLVEAPVAGASVGGRSEARPTRLDQRR